MEIFGVLVIGLVVLFFALPIVAMARASQAKREAEDLRQNVSRLERDIRLLKERLPFPTTPKEATAFPPEHASPESEVFSMPPEAPAPRPVPTRPTPPPLAPLVPFAQSTKPEPLRPSIPHQPIPPLAAPIVPQVHPSAPTPRINWEQFMGVKLFAWLGGLALFLAAAYFVKYSFEHELIPPEVRVALGFLLGLGLLVGGVLMKQRQYAVTSQTLCATGVVILYAVTFACRGVYHFSFFGPLPTFLLMALITCTAFLLAVKLEALVVAVLGMLGGFLTPVLLSTGEDNPVGLFAYIALLDAGLVAVALARPWHFLVVLAAVGTGVMELGWSENFFTVQKVLTALTVFLGFDALFLGGSEVARRRLRSDAWFNGAAAGMAILTMIYALFLLDYAELGQRPAMLGSFVVGADLCLLTLVLREPKWAWLQIVSGALAHLFVALWTIGHLTNAMLSWALGLVLLFAVLHSVFPIVLQRLRPQSSPVWWSHIFPPLALLMMLIPIFRFAAESLLIWPAIMLVDLLAIGLAVLTSSLVSILGALAVTGFVAAIWVFRIPTEIVGLPLVLWVVAGMAILFFAAGLFAIRKVMAGKSGPGELARAFSGFTLTRESTNDDLKAQIPAMSAFLPFLLLILVTLRLPLANPSPVFGLAVLLLALLLGLARTFRVHVLTAVALGCTWCLEAAWHSRHFSADTAGALIVGWHLLFAAVFVAFPFFSRDRCKDSVLPWAVAALSAPSHFPLIYRVVKVAWPNSMMGLLPAAFSVPLLGCLVVLVKWFSPEQKQRNAILAWFGGAALFFITLIFPIQFERQWITVAWALEGAALCWLFHWIPHSGLRLVGVGLLAVAFARLTFNPAVLHYHPRSSTAILNWYLYAYAVTAGSLFAAARLLAPPRHEVLNVKAPPILNTLGTVLVFLLMNIEIADYFTPAGEATLTFQFSGNFARDMSYTIAWAIFALGLVGAGIAWKLAGARYAGLALLSVTLLKLFFHDLARLSQLYRIGALAVVAVVAMLASFWYQRFLAPDAPRTDEQKT